MDLDIGVKYLGDPWGVAALPHHKRTQIRAYWMHCHIPMQTEKKGDPGLLKRIAEHSGSSVEKIRKGLG